MAEHHQMLWPGAELPRQSIQSARQNLWTSRVDLDAKEPLWVDANAQPTSLMFSMLLYGIRSEERNLEDKLWAMKHFKSIFALLLLSVSKISFPVDALGCWRQSRQCEIDSYGKISGGPELIMSSQMYAELENIWNSCRRLPGVSPFQYLTSVFSELEIWDLVSFCLDPLALTHVEEMGLNFRNLMERFGLRLFASLVDCLDKNVALMCKKQSQKQNAKNLRGHRNQKAQKRATMLIQQRSLLALYHGDIDSESCLKLYPYNISSKLFLGT